MTLTFDKREDKKEIAKLFEEKKEEKVEKNNQNQEVKETSQTVFKPST
jgi:hypothetical protein